MLDDNVISFSRSESQIKAINHTNKDSFLSETLPKQNNKSSINTSFDHNKEGDKKEKKFFEKYQTFLIKKHLKKKNEEVKNYRIDHQTIFSYNKNKHVSTLNENHVQEIVIDFRKRGNNGTNGNGGYGEINNTGCFSIGNSSMKESNEIIKEVKESSHFEEKVQLKNYDDGSSNSSSSKSTLMFGQESPMMTIGITNNNNNHSFSQSVNKQQSQQNQMITSNNSLSFCQTPQTTISFNQSSSNALNKQQQQSNITMISNTNNTNKTNQFINSPNTTTITPPFIIPQITNFSSQIKIEPIQKISLQKQPQPQPKPIKTPDLSIDMPERVITVKRINNLMCSLIEWKTRDDGYNPDPTYVKNEFLREKFPQILIKFYEEKIKFLNSQSKM